MELTLHGERDKKQVSKYINHLTAEGGVGGRATSHGALGRLAEQRHVNRELSDEKEPATWSSGRKAEQAEAKCKVLEVGTAHVVAGSLKEW